MLSHQAGTPRNTASVMKLLTTYAALDLLGPTFSWSTDAMTTQPVRDGTLAGPLYLRGSGDPFLTWDRFATFVRELRERGLQRIEGGLIIDRDFFAPADPIDFDGKPVRAYNARSDALMLNFNALPLRLLPGAQGLAVTASLPVVGLSIDNSATLLAGVPCTNWKDSLGTRIAQEGATLHVVLSGGFPTRCGEKHLNLAVPDPARYAGAVFRALWQELGGELVGSISVGNTPASAQSIASCTSPPLAEILRQQNKYSNNVMARNVFLTLSAGNGVPATAQASIARITAWMPFQQLDPAQWTLENGSGLSREERTSAEQLGMLLVAAWNSPRMPDFVSALPIVGIDGTMRKRLVSTPVSGRAYIKTGTLDGVRTAAGYLLDAKGRWHVVVWMINHPRASATDSAFDALLEELYGS